MVSDHASTTPDQYVAALAPDRQPVIEGVRSVVLANLPPGYDEVMAWGMITYEVPLTTQPDTYNGKPLAFAALAAQKRHNSLYLMGLYADSDEDRAFRAAWSPPSGRKLDMGKSCIRFTALEDIDLPLIGATIASMPVERFLALFPRR